uniref:Uncharacterized protein n=1 Tax=Leersia perrieri TaxID=77586 RepID=A0A0D9X6J1_9ORYZ
MEDQDAEQGDDYMLYICLQEMLLFKSFLVTWRWSHVGIVAHNNNQQKGRNNPWMLSYTCANDCPQSMISFKPITMRRASKSWVQASSGIMPADANTQTGALHGVGANHLL